MSGALRLWAAAVAAPLACSCVAHADIVLYANDFEVSTLGPEWSANWKLESNTAFTKFLGRKTNETVRLTLAVPPGPRTSGSSDDGGDDNGGDGGDGGGGDNGGDNDDNGGGGGGNGGGPSHRLYNVTFDLYTIDSWDGFNGAHGPDYFEVLINGGLALSDTFATGTLSQSFRPADTGPLHLGYSPAYTDAIYRQISLEFTLPDDVAQLKLDFRGRNLQPVHDESWGIDNISVGYTVVPAPGPLALGILGAVCAGRRRRI